MSVGVVLNGCVKQHPCTAAAHAKPSAVELSGAEAGPFPPLMSYGVAFEQRRIGIGQSIMIRPEVGTSVTLESVNIADGVACFTVVNPTSGGSHGCIKVGQSFIMFTPLFGQRGAVLTRVDPTGAELLIAQAVSVRPPAPSTR
jgi:hypothetical protein